MTDVQPKSYIGTRLSGMMFLEFFIWGAWFVTVGNFMKARGMEDLIHYAYSVGPVAAIISPFFLGMVADRFFATEKVLGVLLFLGGIAMFLLPWVADISPTLFIIVLFIHTLCYMPTLGLTNSLAFHNIQNQEKQFPIIRVFGTIGWIAAGFFVSKVLHADKGPEPFYVSAAACFLLGLYSFTLPHTPPPAAGKKVTAAQVLGLDALRKLANLPFIVFLLGSFLTCIPLAAYFAYAPVYLDASGFKDPAYNMMYGQVFEVAFMIIMPLFFAVLGVKKMLLAGMAAWVIRYGLFAGAAEGGVAWMIMIGIMLHGICYDFFFVTGFIYTDKRATADVRGQAQGLLVLVTQGLGMLIGAQVAGKLFKQMVLPKGDALSASYQAFWLVPCIMAGVVLILFFLFFKENGKKVKE